MAKPSLTTALRDELERHAKQNDGEFPESVSVAPFIERFLRAEMDHMMRTVRDESFEASDMHIVGVRIEADGDLQAFRIE